MVNLEVTAQINCRLRQWSNGYSDGYGNGNTLQMLRMYLLTSPFYTSTESLYYTSIADPTPNDAPSNARLFPVVLGEYQSKDIKEVWREGQTVSFVKKGEGTKIGMGAQSTGIYEVVADTGMGMEVGIQYMKPM